MPGLLIIRFCEIDVLIRCCGEAILGAGDVSRPGSDGEGDKLEIKIINWNKIKKI